MKKLLFISISIFFVGFINSQSWVAPGATWNYRTKNVLPYLDITTVVTHGGTVTINNKVCDILNSVETGWHNGGFTPWGPISYTRYTNMQNGVLYLYNGISGFDTLVDYKAVPGQGWYIAGWDSTNCTLINVPRQKVTVIDTGHITLNSLSLRTLTVTQTMASNTTRYVERIGSFNGNMNPNYCCVIDCGVHSQLSCYWDNNFAPISVNGWTDCTFFVSTEENQVAKELLVRPNPSSGVFNLEINENTWIRVYSITGSLIYDIQSMDERELKIDLSSQAKGVYYLHAVTAESQRGFKLIKE